MSKYPSVQIIWDELIWKCYGHHHALVNHYEIYVLQMTKDSSVCHNHKPSFSHSRLFTGCVPRVTRRVPHVEQEQITLPEYLILPSVSCGVRVARSLVFCTVFCTILFVSFLFPMYWFFFFFFFFFFELRLPITPVVSSSFLPTTMNNFLISRYKWKQVVSIQDNENHLYAHNTKEIFL